MKITNSLEKFLIENNKLIENKENNFENVNNVGNIEKIIINTIDKINESQQIAENSIKSFMLGKENLHNVLYNLEKAKFVMNLSVKVRDKIIEAYQNIMRMQI